MGYYVNTPPSEEAQALSSALELLTFLMFPLWFGLCIFAAARRFFGKRLQPGFDVLDRAASNIAEQNLEFSVSYDRDDELGHLASSFEAMRASLAESQRALWRTAEERKRLNAAFAHDLRTPLTILKGKIELLDARLDVRDGALVLMVEDDGPGFSNAALERGCAPFFSEVPSAEHFGLGLNIASLMCEKHGGGVTLENREGGGARVVARFSLDFCAE